MSIITVEKQTLIMLSIVVEHACFLCWRIPGLREAVVSFQSVLFETSLASAFEHAMANEDHSERYNEAEVSLVDLFNRKLI